MNKTQAQLSAERAWRETLAYFVGFRSSFNVEDIADKLIHVNFDKDGDMIEHGKAFRYLKKHFPSLFPVWRVRTARLEEESNGKNKSYTKITRRGRRKTTPDR